MSRVLHKKTCFCIYVQQSIMRFTTMEAEQRLCFYCLDRIISLFQYQKLTGCHKGCTVVLKKETRPIGVYEQLVVAFGVTVNSQGKSLISFFLLILHPVILVPDHDDRCECRTQVMKKSKTNKIPAINKQRHTNRFLENCKNHHIDACTQQKK